ncbi:lysosomal alpha-mannosidase-like, partial [Anoplophora glabripennis]
MRNLENENKYEENVRSLREVMGTMQHHDAITGTEKEHVAADYTRMLTKAIRETESHLGKVLGNLLKKDDVTDDITLPVSSCLLANISSCENALKDKYMVTVYNPLSRYVTYYVRLPAKNGAYNITGPD